MRSLGRVEKMGCPFVANKLCRSLGGIHTNSRSDLFTSVVGSPLEANSL